MANTQELVLRHLKRNFACHLFDGAFWAAGYAALGLFTIMPGLIHEIGLRYPAIKPFENRLATLTGICFFGISQFISFFVAGKYESRSVRLPAFLKSAIMQRTGILLIAAATLGMEYIGYQAYLFILFLSLACYGISSGFAGPLWIDFVGRLVPVNRRGILLGCRDTLGTLMSVGILSLFPFLGSRFAFPHNYGIMYTISMFFFFLSFGALCFFKEIPYSREDLKPRRPLKRQIKDNLSILRTDREFRNLIITLSFLSLAGLGNLSLITMRAMNTLQLAGASAVSFTGIIAMTISVANSLSILTFGFFGDRWGYKRIGYVCYSVLLGAYLVAIFAHSMPQFMAAVALTGIAGGGMTVFGVNFPLEFAPENSRPTYSALRSLCGAPFIILPFVGGWIADSFGSIVVFTAACVCIAVGIFALKIGVTDPRRRMQQVMVAPETDLAADVQLR
jgi:MFS family permease